MSIPWFIVALASTHRGFIKMFQLQWLVALALLAPLVSCKINVRSCKAKEKYGKACNFEKNSAAVLKDVIAEAITLDKEDKKFSVEIVEKVVPVGLASL